MKWKRKNSVFKLKCRVIELNYSLKTAFLKTDMAWKPSSHHSNLCKHQHSLSLPSDSNAQSRLRTTSVLGQVTSLQQSARSVRTSYTPT